MSTIVLITGANRGLGKGLLEHYLLKPNHIVIAANRTPDHPSSEALFNLPHADTTRLLLVKIDGASDTDASDAVKELASQGIEHIDIVIANAGVMFAIGKVSDVKIDDIKGHMDPNVYGVIRLYQALLPILSKSEKPIWVTMGSGAGRFDGTPPIPNAAYAPTKTMVHWLTKKMNEEEDHLTAFVMDPGWVQTDMGNIGAKMFGVEQAPLALDDSISGMVRVIDAATKETHGGRYMSYEEKELPW